MDSKRFKRKKFTSLDVPSKLPELLNDKPFIGIFNGYNVTVFDKHAIRDVYNEGNFGKGSLSKSAPTRDLMVDDIPEIILQQQWENRMKWQGDSEIAQDEDKRICIDSIQNLLNSTYIPSGDSWKKWRGNRITQSKTECNENESMKIVTSSCSQNDSNNDPIISMVENILLTGKLKEDVDKQQGNMKMVLVVESNGDLLITEEDMSRVKVKLRKCVKNVKETLKLSLVEAFFLSFAVQRMKIMNEDGVTLSCVDLWKLFSQAEYNFISKYVAYHHYRSHGWTVKSGIKFGGDYLLYKTGPAYYHASYLVWLLDKKRKNKLSWSEFVALNRLVETCNKDLLLCAILQSNENDEDLSSPNALRNFSVLQVVTKRWIPSQERLCS